MNMSSSEHTVDSERLLSFCKATAESLRLDILRILSVESFGVMELCHIFDTAQPGMSHHLKILTGASLLQTRREGNSIYYRRAIISSEDTIKPLVASLFDAVDRTRIAPEIMKRRDDIHQDRTQHAKVFFEKNADRLKENQDLVAEFSHYAGCVNDLLSNEDLSSDAKVIEVGPGESDLMEVLHESYGSIVAIDNVAEMLNKSQAKSKAGSLDRIEFLLGELSDFESSQRADLIVLNMVLHHLPSPAQIFKSAHRMLNPGGRLLIADLCSHDQDWTQEICGDLWLGFDPDDLDKWATDAELKKGQSVYLGLRNGFQVQVRLYQQTTT
jgi:ArsR family transcriptional regulator